MNRIGLTPHIAPEGWHVPTDAEWTELEIALGMSQSERDGEYYRGTNEGSKLVGSAILWDSGVLKNNSEFGSSGFNALPAGMRFSAGYCCLGGYGAFWSTTEHGKSWAWARRLDFNSSEVYRENYDGKGNFNSIRCLRD